MKLYYFNLYARAEPIRMLLFKAGVQYEDVRVGFPEWDEFKAHHNPPNGQLPMLVLEDGTKMT